MFLFVLYLKCKKVLPINKVFRRSSKYEKFVDHTINLKVVGLQKCRRKHIVVIDLIDIMDFYTYVVHEKNYCFEVSMSDILKATLRIIYIFRSRLLRFYDVKTLRNFLQSSAKRFLKEVSVLHYSILVDFWNCSTNGCSTG